MSDAPAARLLDHFAALDDPRVERTRHHALLDIVAIALCAVICGADGWVEVEAFGQAKRLAGELPGAAQRHPVARHLRAGLRRARPGAVRSRVSLLGGGGGGPERRDGGGRRWQDAAALPRCRPPARRR